MSRRETASATNIGAVLVSECRENGGRMATSKRQQTMAKIRREQAVRERRTLKQEKKEAARQAKRAGGTTAVEADQDPADTDDAT